MATPKRNKVVISNSSLGNVVAGGNITNLRMTSTMTGCQRKPDEDYCGSSDADLEIRNTVAGNVVIDASNISNIQMESQQSYTSSGDSSPFAMGAQGNVDSGFPVQEENIDSKSAYKLSSKPKGRVLIINNVGEKSSKVFNRMKETWSNMGYLCYITSEKLTAEKLESEVRNFSQKRYLKYTDCIVLIVLCHGNGKEFKGSDGVSVPVDELTKNFEATNCKNMQTKPKLMFFEYFTEDDVFLDAYESNQITGHKSDTYIAQKKSTKTDFDDQGSKFFGKMTEVLNERSTDMEINDIMRKIGCHVSTEDSLNYQFYFSPHQT